MEQKPNKDNIFKEETEKNFLNKKRKRGRPKDNPYEKIEKAKNEFISFLNNPIRAKKNNEKIGLKEIKKEIQEIIDDISKKGEKEFEEVFENLKNQDINKYFIIENWDSKEKKEIYILDQILVKFLKEFSSKVNKKYFFFALKLIIYLREYINYNRQRFVKKKNEKNEEDKKLYSEINGANIVNQIGNDFLILFLMKFDLFKFFEIESINDIKKEIIELYMHLCFWLNENNYTEAFLIKYEKKEEKVNANKPKKNKK